MKTAISNAPQGKISKQPSVGILHEEAGEEESSRKYSHPESPAEPLKEALKSCIDHFFLCNPVEETKDFLWQLYAGWVYHAEAADGEEHASMLMFYESLRDLADELHLIKEKTSWKIKGTIADTHSPAVSEFQYTGMCHFVSKPTVSYRRDTPAILPLFPEYSSTILLL